MTDRPRILAVTRDRAFLKAVRLDMPLVNLKKQGLIEDYFITNPSLFDLPSDFVFDVVWLQRVEDPRLIAHLADRIDSRYLYDLDDLLIGRAPARTPVSNRQVVLDAVRRCRVLTVTSSRLASILERVGSVQVHHKAVVCPNAYEFSRQVRTPEQPRGLILTSSEGVALTLSAAHVLGAVQGFSRQYQLPVFTFGPADERVTEAFPSAVHFGRVPYWHYQTLLAALPPMIGIAPLETAADQQTLDFINGKSDVKMMEFGGFGHPSVYSVAPPYVDTDLRAGITVENTREAWSEGLEAMYRDGWKSLDVEQRSIVELRHMDRVAAQCWSEAIDRARLPKPLTGREIGFSRGRVTFFVNAAKHMVLSQDHVFLKRVEEQIPSSVLRVLRRLFLNT